MELTPLKLHPVYRDYIWGGSRLKSEYGKTDAPDRTAESWELSCIPGSESTVFEGEHRGKTLPELAELFGTERVFGRKCPRDGFPVLVKLIDARNDLSVQVHPSDETALARLGEKGKAEMWYVVDCEPRSELYLGFSRQLSKGEFLRRAKDGSICSVLNRVNVRKGDVFYVLPGTIHAIRGGVLVAEIQQSSDTTFRVYDYERLGTDGQPRALHIEQAARVLDYSPLAPALCRVNNSVRFREYTLSEMFSCRYFRAFSLDVRESIRLRTDGESFHYFLCVEGEGSLRCGDAFVSLKRGEGCFIPAQCGEYELTGECSTLLSML